MKMNNKNIYILKPGVKIRWHEQTEVNDRMLENTKVVMACDPTVGQDIDFGNL